MDIQADSHRIGARLEILGENRTGLSALVNIAGSSQSVGVCVGTAGFPNARGNTAILLARLPDRHAL